MYVISIYMYIILGSRSLLMYNVYDLSLSLLQTRHRVGVAIGDWVLDLSVVAPVFFTGPELAKNAQVRVRGELPSLPSIRCTLGMLCCFASFV